MRIHYGGTMMPIDYYLPLAMAAEECGYSGVTVSDSLFYPKSSTTKYTYTDDGDRSFIENKPFPEVFALASAIGAVTSRIEITTNVAKIPIRPPVYSAKLVTTIAAMTHNRFNLGAGLSVWPEDYSVMGVGFEQRGRRMEECLQILQGFGRGEYFEFSGEFYDIPPLKLNPAPSRPIPIFIGGHSDAALKRAARFDGWISTSCPEEELARMI